MEIRTLQLLTFHILFYKMDSLFEHLKDVHKMTRRKYASFFENKDKQRKELGVVESLLEGMLANGENLYHDLQCSKKDPPDCIAYDNEGRLIGFEITEFVDQDAVEENEVADKENSVCRRWTQNDVIDKIEEIIKDKDFKLKNISKDNDPYFRMILIIYADEPDLSYNDYCQILPSVLFSPPQNVDEVIFLVSYEPRIMTYPYFRLNIQE